MWSHFNITSISSIAWILFFIFLFFMVFVFFSFWRGWMIVLIPWNQLSFHDHYNIWNHSRSFDVSECVPDRRAVKAIENFPINNFPIEWLVLQDVGASQPASQPTQMQPQTRTKIMTSVIRSISISTLFLAFSMRPCVRACACKSKINFTFRNISNSKFKSIRNIIRLYRNEFTCCSHNL